MIFQLKLVCKLVMFSDVLNPMYVQMQRKTVTQRVYTRTQKIIQICWRMFASCERYYFQILRQTFQLWPVSSPQWEVWHTSTCNHKDKDNTKSIRNSFLKKARSEDLHSFIKSQIVTNRMMVQQNSLSKVFSHYFLKPSLSSYQ